MKRIEIIVLFLILCLSVTGCGSKDQNKLVMVTEAGFAPYEFYENGKIVGVDVEIAQEIAQSLGKELEIKDVAFDVLINEIQSGKADFAAAGMSITAERLEQADFTIEYTTSNQVVVVRQDSQIKDLTNLGDLRISVQLGSVADSYATKNYKNATISRQKKFLVAAEEVKNNKSDCIIMDALPARQLVKNNPELKIVDGILFQDKYGMAVKKGNKELLDAMNQVLERLMSEGKIEQYILKYSE